MSIKPIIGIKHNERLHEIYWGRFKAHYNSLRKSPKSLEELILSGLFLCITFEAYINDANDFLLENVNVTQNRRIRQFYNDSIKNSAKLTEKFIFLVDVFLADRMCLKERRKIKNFILKKWGPLRNKIVHGSEFSITTWSNYKVEKSPLASLLSVREIDSLHKDFLQCMTHLNSIFDKIDMDEVTSGSNRNFILNYLRFKPPESS